MKCAVIYICTGGYQVFWEEFYETAKTYLLPDCKRDIFVFTDNEEMITEQREDVKPYFFRKNGWPYDSLLRWNCICMVQDLLAEYDYVLFCNANMKFLLPFESNLFTAKPFTFLSLVPEEITGDQLPFDRNEQSRACIPVGTKRNKYAQGGFFAIRGTELVEMSRMLRDWTAEDLQHKQMPKYHDESMINAYLYRCLTDDKVAYLGKETIAPEEFNQKDVLAIFRNKDHYGGNKGLRYNQTLGDIDKFFRRVKRVLHLG